MKDRKYLCIDALALTLILVGACCYGQNYAPKADEEIYGTWINKQYSGLSSMRPQKSVVTADGYKRYLMLTDSGASQEGTVQIVSKWTDAEGNIWYRTFRTVTSRPDEGVTIAELDRLSNSATV
jgi:hypothetical protein